ncbi:glycogen debranching protein GlgX [Sphingobium yanoikuyae]|uniref:Glycogen debranching protein GlgX n=1 Tax=Sphingobium yanoikuyae TaxID=13690 RepID=A0AA42WTT2_SPHYA|nr:glycogen debranching protein GlgX [Sphingobium yanoikuyae]MDH2131664.1 glycogen debranching protein GlgX [Sphingobium yanoikuyae]MDH2153052.1 glycogen debranching protein GlgX [Sphingobium yanoikuyae]MDH2166821.1 glycogen debranching protein GlgX [Sphingobium yanoikuyae]
MSAGGFGPVIDAGGTRFAVWAPEATQIWLCLFDQDDRETRLPMTRGEEGIWQVHAPGVGAGARYGLRADGPYDPDHGLWFDPDKLLLDPYAPAIDRAFVHDPMLAAPRGQGEDTAPLMPKGVVAAPLQAVAPAPPCFQPGGLLYELQVRSFSLLHPDVPEAQRGTIAALAHPVVIDHLQKLGVGAVELMPINAWIDERHLPPHGLRNAWGYNPVSYFALDPRLAPGGLAELREATAALHDAGIGVMMDMVYNHDGESDRLGPTLSLRGLNARAYFRHEADGRLINDTGTGNSVDCNQPMVRRLILESLRHFVVQAGIDGFRFDLAPALGRLPDGFDRDAPLLAEMRADPVLGDRILIAEPWDIGPGGYQLGRFGPPWLEWNDRYRDDMRRFWRGDAGTIGAFATRLAGSSDIFEGTTRSVNFLAAHDGFTLADCTAYADKHNLANGEDNRDGHGENFSWNNGVEGASDDPTVIAARRRDIKALLSTLFCSRGTIMLTAGDEFGRSQMGNNNAYAQDNGISWIEWDARDREIEAHAFALGQWRRNCAELTDVALLGEDDVVWLDEGGQPLSVAQWEDPARGRLVLHFRASGLSLCINGAEGDILFETPGGPLMVPGRSVMPQRRSVIPEGVAAPD